MELRELRSFIAVAEHRSFTRAADSLDLAQPSLTMQIKKLERELGVELLRRMRPLLELTEAGEAFLAEARLLVAQAKVAADTARLAARGEIGRLSLAWYDSAAFVIMPQLLRRFLARYPQVRLEVIELSSNQQIAALKKGRIDAAVVRGPIWEDGVESRQIAVEELVLAVSAEHRLAAQERVAVEELRREPFVLAPRSKGAGLYDEIISLCHRHDFNPTVGIEAYEMHTICGLVAAGIGVSIVPSSVRALHTEGIVYRPLAPQSTINRSIAWQAHSRSPALRAFIETLPHAPLRV